ncbi:tRNA pseudouridine(13) synthase TruD [Vibrio sonorensis]|uniref:tRNA pseudouridine(13) synthase TruD n=1 Tax=Vibrio sonorensis TaxID=1004316 RepID=UPI0008D910FA|nr:tRNA pseudouridine(13) synthase TruD [Vibrio sonorensis]
MSDILADFAYLNGKPTETALLKAQPDHFQVTEDLGFEFSGEGEHLMVLIRKTGENTSFVANELAKACGVKSQAVSWAGLKDRHAVTEQWLSVHLPGNQTPDFTEFLKQYPSIEIVKTQRHNKKLRPGDLSGNFFKLVLTQVSDASALVPRFESIKQFGVPNYFGQQRFGHQGNNLDEARRWGRENVRTRNQKKRSMYLSTARSWIFNQIVSSRIESDFYQQFVEGDIALESGKTHPVESPEQWNEKLNEGLVQITAALAGDNALPVTGKALELEQPFLDAEPDLMALIRGNRMRHERRPIALVPQQFDWEIAEQMVTMTFWLPAGHYATSIVRELVVATEAERSYG